MFSGILSRSQIPMSTHRVDSGRCTGHSARSAFLEQQHGRVFATDHPDAMRRVLEGLIASMVGFPEVEAVRLDFEGHNALGLGQCADLLRTPQAWPDILNDERILARVAA